MRRILLALALAPFVAGAQEARPEGARVLRRALEQGPRVQLEGVRRVVLPGGERLRERVLRDGMKLRLEILEPPELAGGVAVESGRERRQYVPSRNEIRVQPAAEAEFYMRLRRWANAPPDRLSGTPGGTVAGRPTRKVEVEGPTGRPMQRVWVDVASGAVLKSEALGPQGEVLAGFEFVTVGFSPEFKPGDFELDFPGARLVTPLEDLRRLARERNLVPYRLPASDSWQLVSVRPIGAPRARALMQTYAMQDMRVSLFQIFGRDIDGDRVAGLVGPGMQVHAFRKGEARLYMIGDLGQEALARLAQRVQG